MSENDIEFDFFEEPDTRETAEERPRRRGQRPPVRPPTGLTPLLRLIGLISFAILIVLLLVLWVNGCREDKRKDAYRDYVTTVSDYANQSQRLGRQFNTLLTSTGKKESDVESELAGLAGQQDQITNNARNLDPPGHLRDQDSHMLEAFELRSNGLRAMSDAFRSTASSKNADAAGSDLAVQMRRFIASDVLWQDFFKEPTKEELEKIGVTGVNVPDSLFLRNPDIATLCVDEGRLAAGPRRRYRRGDLQPTRDAAGLDDRPTGRQGALGPATRTRSSRAPTSRSRSRSRTRAARRRSACGSRSRSSRARSRSSPARRSR